ncbi:MAG: hypothetical protein JWM99_2115 [Verrucomicrobiales bacterium]|nr:hypothetical protein [Verrucomicrobiales bacterium]
MTNEDVKRNIWRNSISNYIFLFLRLGLGMVVFRLINQSLSEEQFGFWALLWSVFGYGILLDFGFGFTAQKRVAELSVKKEWTQLSGVLSTIFFVYLAVAGILILIGLFGSPYIIRLFAVTPENRPYFTKILMIFFCGMGLAFPMGIFPEILRGQQRISLTNWILIAGYSTSFVLVFCCLHYHWGLAMLFVITLSCSILSDLMCGFFALKHMPMVRIAPAFFSQGMVRDTMKFSIFAYVSTLSTIILTRTDQLVIGSALSVAAVAIYQRGAKVGDMFSNFALQIPETLSPAAAHLHASGDKDFLRRLLIDGTRITVLLATPLYLICACYMDSILRIITGFKQSAPETYWVGEVLLFWAYTTVLTQSVTKRIFMMCGHERRLMWLSISEAGLNLGLSLGLVLYYRNVICVALGSLIATFVFGWFCIWPWAAREANLSGLNLARAVVLPAWIACIPLLALLLIERNLPYFNARENTGYFLVEAAVACAVAFAGLWALALKPVEREKCLIQFSKLFRGNLA